MGVTAEEHRERYLTCRALFADCIAYCHRKQLAHVKWAAEVSQQLANQCLRAANVTSR